MFGFVRRETCTRLQRELETLSKILPKKFGLWPARLIERIAHALDVD